MIIKKAEFITSAARPEQFIRISRPMIVVCGKSNVGKSSFINMIANKSKLAKTSATPGKTRLVNYFDFGEFILADLPGYGYAEAGKAEQERWGRTLDKFFEKKEDITHVFVLADIRHEPTEDDKKMIEYLNYHAVPFTVIATKSDKLSRMKVKENVKKIAACFKLGADNIIAVSNETKVGKDDVLRKVAHILSVAENGVVSDDAFESQPDSGAKE